MSTRRLTKAFWGPKTNGKMMLKNVFSNSCFGKTHDAEVVVRFHNISKCLVGHSYDADEYLRVITLFTLVSPPTEFL